MTTPSPAPVRRPRGSALLFVIILLAVMSLIGGASVLLSSRERQNAAAKTAVSTSIACAHAAQAKLWAELAKYGFGNLASAMTVTDVRELPDGTQLAVPAHYRELDGSSGVISAEIMEHAQAAGAASAGGGERNAANSDQDATQMGQTLTATARCTTPGGRDMEVEIGVRFAL
jgi:hypothetical protein